MDAMPMGWHVRFIFSELLDPDIETLNEDGSGSLADTLPAVLRCNDVELEYDGWYDPTGSQLSFPPGPALIVELPADTFIATGSPCEVSLVDGVVTDKDGEVLPSDPLGPFAFAIAPLAVAESSPEDESEGVTLDSAIEIVFNAPVEIGTVQEDGRVVVTADGAAVAGTLALKVDEETEEVSDEIVVFTPAGGGGLVANTEYVVTVNDGVTDIEGGLLAQEEAFTATFTTGEAE